MHIIIKLLKTNNKEKSLISSQRKMTHRKEKKGDRFLDGDNEAKKPWGCIF